MGYTYFTLKLSQDEPVDTKTLLEGFRRWGVILRMILLQGGLYLLIAFVSANISSSVFMMTPWAAPLIQATQNMAAGAELTPEALMAMAQDATLPLTLITLVIFIPLLAPFYYQYRLAFLCLLDGEQNSALFAMRESRAWMRGNRVALFKLDLHFWWYYALELLVSALSFLDLGLATLGIALPWPGAISTFICFGLYAVGQLLLHWCFKNYVFVAYAQGYNALISQDATP